MDLKEYIKTLVRELLDEESTTAGVPGYLTPNAFSLKDKNQMLLLKQLNLKE